MDRSKADDDAVTNALVGGGLYSGVWLLVAACYLLCGVAMDLSHV
jgi:hypothetical protein